MSERYGAPGELQEGLEDLENWINHELDRLRKELKQPEKQSTASYNAGRIDAFRDVLDVIIVNKDG